MTEAPATDDTARLAATIEAEALQRAGTITYTQARQRIRDRQASPVAHLALQQTDALNRALAAPLGGTFEGPLFDAVWLTWDAYTEQLAHRIGDQGDWLQWHCNDNAMGRKGLEASSWSRIIKVRTLRQLAAVIAGSR